MLELLVINPISQLIFIFSLHYKHMSHGPLTYVTKKCHVSLGTLQIYQTNTLHSFLTDVGQLPRTQTMVPDELRSRVKKSSKTQKYENERKCI